MGLPAFNAITHGAELGDAVAQVLGLNSREKLNRSKS
jgi:hypothetical protein